MRSIGITPSPPAAPSNRVRPTPAPRRRGGAACARAPICCADELQLARITCRPGLRPAVADRPARCSGARIRYSARPTSLILATGPVPKVMECDASSWRCRRPRTHPRNLSESEHAAARHAQATRPQSNSTRELACVRIFPSPHRPVSRELERYLCPSMRTSRQFAHPGVTTPSRIPPFGTKHALPVRTRWICKTCGRRPRLGIESPQFERFNLLYGFHTN